MNAVICCRARPLPIGCNSAVMIVNASHRDDITLTAAVTQFIPGTYIIICFQPSTMFPLLQVPWESLRHVIGDCYYGCHISNSEDRQTLHTMLEHVLNEACAGRPAYALSPSGAVKVPDPGTFASMLEHIEGMGSRMLADTVWLPATADIAKDTSEGQHMQECLARIHTIHMQA